MFPTSIKHALENIGSLYKNWRAAGSGCIAASFNIVCLGLLWLMAPLESEPLGLGCAATRRSSILRSTSTLRSFSIPCASSSRRSFSWLSFRRAVTARASCARSVDILRAAGALINRVGDAFGAAALRCVRAVVDDSEEKKPGGRRLPSWVPVVLLVPGLVLAALCITQPFNLHGQIVFLALMFVSMIVLMRIRARITLMLLFVISFVVSGRYLWWRCTSTVSTGNGLDLFFGVLLLVAEVYAFSVMVLGYFQVCWVLDRKPAALPADRSVWPHVDIFIPTYNESLDVIKPTVYAALNMDWPADKLHVYVLDDGSRDFIQAFAEAAGAGYIKREEHNHAKAGNINHAMTVTSGEYIVIFDCDHVPSNDFLVSTTGWLVRDPKIALVQTPHHFYSPDPFEKNMHLERAMPIENSLFHDFIQKGNDTWNATMFCGSSAVMRRKALEEIGGIAGRDRDRRRSHVSQAQPQGLELGLHLASARFGPLHGDPCGPHRPAHSLGARHDPDLPTRQSDAR